MYKLELVNKKTKEVTIFDDIVDINYGEKLFFNFEINATQLADGEYTLSLYEDGKLIVTDTLCVGDFDVVGLQYKKGEAIYIETKLETKTQDKSVEINGINTTILPDEGYDAMTTVQVNAQPVYDGAYNVGHTEGYESGIRAQKEKLESIEITANGVYSKEDGYNNIVVEVPDVNGSYDEGYDAGYSEGVEEGTSNAGAIIAETAQVLNITENGVYATKYSKDEDGDLPVTSEGNLIRTVNVNVVPTINPTEYGVRFGYSTFTALPDIFELPQRIEASKLELLFSDATKLTDISCFEGMTEIYFDRTFLTAMSVLHQTFQYCTSLADLTPLSNIRIVLTDDNFTTHYTTAKIQFNYAFQNTAVTDFSPLAHIFDGITYDYTFDIATQAFASTALKRFELDWDWSKCTNYYQSLGANTNIEYIQELDATSVKDGYNPLDVLSILGSGTANLTYFGGYKNQKLSMTSNYFLTKCPNLTRESCLAIVNNLYDFTGNGEVPTTSQGKLKVHSNFLDALGDDINIAANKGWIITA